MFRIYLHSTNGSEWLSLEGALSGPCVEDLERCWIALGEPRRNEPLLLDITGLQSADQNGRRLLKRMHTQGVLLGRSPMKQRNAVLGLCQKWFGAKDRNTLPENVLHFQSLL